MFYHVWLSMLSISMGQLYMTGFKISQIIVIKENKTYVIPGLLYGLFLMKE